MSESLEQLKIAYLDLIDKSSKLARKDFKKYMELAFLEYDFEWFHHLIMDELQDWIEKKNKKLAIFVPPQHAKSTLSSIGAPSFILGKNPKSKVVCASYGKTVSSKFNRQTQDIMVSPMYRKIFPNTRLPKSGVDKDNELRNQSYFQTIKSKGSYLSVGVEGALTSETVEYGIIDDPIKDRIQANSETYRQRLWDWYIDVWSTRLNNDSCELLLFTRWHEDDLAGRLFNPKNEHYDEERAKKWRVIVLPALKENVKSTIPQAIEIDDPRKENEALWEKKHSAEKFIEIKRTAPYSFASLQQQRPSPLSGGLMQREWFEIIEENLLPFDPETEPVHFMIDGAFTDKTENDPSAIIAYYVYKKKCYIKWVISVRKELKQYLDFVHPWILGMGYDSRSWIRIEYKSSGPALGSMLGSKEYDEMNVKRINNVHVSWGKITRGQYAQPSVGSGKVVLIKGAWNEGFISQCVTFPNDTHDDEFDLLCYMVLQEIGVSGIRVRKSSVNLKRNKLKKRK